MTFRSIGDVAADVVKDLADRRLAQSRTGGGQGMSKFHTMNHRENTKHKRLKLHLSRKSLGLCWAQTLSDEPVRC